MRALFLSLVGALLVGCATYRPVPDGYTGPVAVLWDSGFSEDSAKAQIFAVEQIDGHNVGNSFVATAHASSGQGFRLTTRFVERRVPVRPMKVALRASHATAAPIHALFSQAAGTFFSVEGVVDFNPEPNRVYVVKGELKKEGSSVWIEDATTKQIVTERIVKK